MKAKSSRIIFTAPVTPNCSRTNSVEHLNIIRLPYQHKEYLKHFRLFRQINVQTFRFLARKSLFRSKKRYFRKTSLTKLALYYRVLCKIDIIIFYQEINHERISGRSPGIAIESSGRDRQDTKGHHLSLRESFTDAMGRALDNRIYYHTIPSNLCFSHIYNHECNRLRRNRCYFLAHTLKGPHNRYFFAKHGMAYHLILDFGFTGSLEDGV